MQTTQCLVGPQAVRKTIIIKSTKITEVILAVEFISFIYIHFFLHCSLISLCVKCTRSIPVKFTNHRVINIITRLIVIDIALLFCNCLLFCLLVCGVTNLFCSGNFWHKLPSWFFIPNRPPKHVITSTNHELYFLDIIEHDSLPKNWKSLTYICDTLCNFQKFFFPGLHKSLLFFYKIFKAPITKLHILNLDTNDEHFAGRSHVDPVLNE